MNKRPYRTLPCTQTPSEQREQPLDGTRGNPFHLKKKKKRLLFELLIITTQHFTDFTLYSCEYRTSKGAFVSGISRKDSWELATSRLTNRN